MSYLKKCVLILGFSFLTAIAAFSSDISLSFDAGLETAIPIYGDSTVRKVHNSIKNVSGNRIVLGVTADVNLALVKYLTVFVGSDFISDFNWKDKSHFNHLDLAIFPGLKIYPGLGGFNFSVAYAIGTRFDFCSNSLLIVPAEDSSSEPTKISYDSVSWGNGLRLGVEYNFYYGSKKRFLPSLGAYWRWMPRGNYHSDNILALYALVNF